MGMAGKLPLGLYDHLSGGCILAPCNGQNSLTADYVQQTLPLRD